jgi:hypothetical protein
MKFLFMSIVIFNFLSAETFISDTTLEWQDNVENTILKKNWIDANNYCKNLTLSHSDNWRLPSIRELQSIVNIEKYKPAIADGFKHTNTSDYYWSGSSQSGDDTKAWHVYYKYGDSYYSDKSEKYYVRCIRNR